MRGSAGLFRAGAGGSSLGFWLIPVLVIFELNRKTGIERYLLLPLLDRPPKSPPWNLNASFYPAMSLLHLNPVVPGGRLLLLFLPIGAHPSGTPPTCLSE